MKPVTINNEVPERMIPSAPINKLLFKIFDILKIIGPIKIIGGVILFIIFINWSISSSFSAISLKKLRSNDGIPLLPRPWPAEQSSVEPGNFKLVELDRFLTCFFKIDLLKAKGKKEETLDWTKWEWARVFKLEQEKSGSLFFMAKGKEKSYVANEDSDGGKQEAGKNKTEGKEIIKPEFKNIKEKTSVYVFLAWLWLVIGVLLYILNEQIKEAERRRQLGL